MTKSELRSIIREILKEELSKTNNEHLAEAIIRRTITRDEIKNISISADKFAVMTDPR